MTALGAKTTMADRHRGFAARIAARHGLAGADVPDVARRLRRPAALSVALVRARPVLRLTRHWSPTIAVALAPRFVIGSPCVTRLAVVQAPALQASEAARGRGRTTLPAAVHRAAPAAAMDAAMRRTTPAPAMIPAPSDQLIRFRTLRDQVFQVRLAQALDTTPATVAASEAAPLPRRPAAPGPRREIAVASLTRSMARAAEAPLAAAVGRLETVVSRLANQTKEEIWREIAWPKAPASMPDTKLIAEQVLRTLDHRVIALRERMGRR
jgi:hypothetical protein